MPDYSKALLKNFICVTSVAENGAIIRYYGGDQAWFDTENGRAGGCGTVAAANILAYFGVFFGDSQRFSKDARPSGDRCYERGAFTAHMHEVYRGLTHLVSFEKQG